MQSKSSIFIVDDDEAICDALSGLFESEGFDAQSFASAEAFLAAGNENAPGCAIVDIQMPGMSGLDLQKELVRRGATIPVIVLTSHGDVTTAVTALKGGAIDFIEKPFKVEALMASVTEALSRQSRHDRAKAERAEIAARLSRLTAREREVLDLVVAGDPNKVVAAKLGISVRTAETHRAKVMDKMECANLPALIHLMLLR